MTTNRLPFRQTDYGFFGPDSPTWKVWTAPTALLGFQRSVVLEHFDPDLTAAVADMGGIYSDPYERLDRTFAYFLTAAVADSRTAISASEALMRVHTKATGIEPISGKRYSANDPESQRWIHITGWHSVLKCYEQYGPGALTPDEEARYWADCVIAAELQTCAPASIPRSREDVREYFAEVRPRLCLSERAREGMHYLLRTPRAHGGFKLWAGSRLVAPAVIATLPMWMRTLGGFGQPRVVDVGYRPLTQTAALLAQSERVRLAVLRTIMPNTARLFEQHITAGEPELPAIVTPAEARRLSGRSRTQDSLVSGLGG